MQFFSHHIRVHRPRSRSPTHRTTRTHIRILKPSCPHPKAQCVRVRCAIRPSGAIKRSRTGHSLNNLRLQSPRENDVMIVVSETPACQHRKNPADPTTISLRVHHAVSTALVSSVILVWREELHGSSSSSEAFPGYTALG